MMVNKQDFLKVFQGSGIEKMMIIMVSAQKLLRREMKK